MIYCFYTAAPSFTKSCQSPPTLWYRGLTWHKILMYLLLPFQVRSYTGNLPDYQWIISKQRISDAMCGLLALYPTESKLSVDAHRNWEPLCYFFSNMTSSLIGKNQLKTEGSQTQFFQPFWDEEPLKIPQQKHCKFKLIDNKHVYFHLGFGSSSWISMQGI